VTLLDLIVVGGTALGSSLLGSVAGTGGTLVLLPVLVPYFGIQDAIAIVTLANAGANLSRAVMYWPEVHRRVTAWFTLGSLPLTVLGTWLFTVTAPELLTRLLGVFLLGMVVWRHVYTIAPQKRGAIWFLPLGVGFGFLNGLVPSIGPLMAPFFLAYGLVKGSYIGTDACITVIMQVTKLAVFKRAQVLSTDIMFYGALLIPLMFAGAFLGKLLVDRLPGWVFALIIEMTIIIAGVDFLMPGVWGTVLRSIGHVF
jgi:uncharacterized membrane protein YfcA